LQIDQNPTGLSVLRSSRFEIPALTHDPYVRITLRLQLLPNLTLGDRRPPAMDTGPLRGADVAITAPAAAKDKTPLIQ
jgi:hypothetical protein